VRAETVLPSDLLFRLADAAAAAVDASIAKGSLLEEAVDDHDVHKHYRTGG
jgi:hypothetical protein